MIRSIHRLAAEDLAQAVRFYKSEAGAGLARRFLKLRILVVRHQSRDPEYGAGRR